MASEGFHEDPALLPEETKNLHRALRSAIEELDAVDWYEQRVVASQDDALRAILAHNRDEEIEHFAMELEWLRRRIPKMDEHLHKYLFHEGDIVAREKENALDGAAGGDGLAAPARRSFTIGPLRER